MTALPSVDSSFVVSAELLVGATLHLLAGGEHRSHRGGRQRGGAQELARIVHPPPTVNDAVLDAGAVDGRTIHA